MPTDTDATTNTNSNSKNKIETNKRRNNDNSETVSAGLSTGGLEPPPPPSSSPSTSPRRSARLQMKREIESDMNSENGTGRNVRTRIHEDRIVNEDDCGHEYDTVDESGDDTDDSDDTDDTDDSDSESDSDSDSDNISDTTTSDNPTHSTATSGTTPFSFSASDAFPSLLSFTFTFEDGRLIPSDAASAAMPPEMRALLMGQIGGRGRTAGVFGVSGMAIPLTRMTADNPSIPVDTPAVDFLDLARQLVQIIFRNRSADTTVQTEMEGLLNNFMTRILGASASTAPAGLAADRVAALPIIVEPAEFDCSICRDVARPGSEKCVQLQCKHCFHFECIQPWLSRVSSCPICRKVIE